MTDVAHHAGPFGQIAEEAAFVELGREMAEEVLQLAPLVATWVSWVVNARGALASVDIHHS